MMKQQKIIDTAAFGVYYDDKNGSEITFGGIDTDRIPSLDKLSFADLYNDEYWSINITLVRYGKAEISNNSRYGILDTATSLILLPHEDYSQFVKQAQKGKVCHNSTFILG